MGFGLAVKAFFKALRDTQGAQKFVESESEVIEDKSDASHLRLLTHLQKSGRLIDFFQEDISSFSDAQVGAAVRAIHENCQQRLEEWVTIRPVMEEQEGSSVTVPAGYDPQKIKVIGNVSGKPPFKGTIRHRGWCAHKRSLPKQLSKEGDEVLQPAEVEVS